MTDEWEVRLTLAVDPPPDDNTVQPLGSPTRGAGPASAWPGVAGDHPARPELRLAAHDAARCGRRRVRRPSTGALADEGLALERVIDVAIVSATRDERDW